MDKYNTITEQIEQSIAVKRYILECDEILALISKAVEIIVRAYRNGNKVLLCGNGGSASDALHIEGELVGRFKMNRKALPAIAMVSSTATFTSIVNDYGYETIFERQIEAHGNRGDVLIAISTSGNSPNVVNGIKKAREQGLLTIALTGRSGGDCRELADIAIRVPSDDTPRIQESHITIGHIICDLVEKELFGDILIIRGAM